jgi:cyclophilin family peptidyl-prolyl cis-trans isomerase
MKINILLLSLLFLIYSCHSQKETGTIVLITTEFGDIKLRLYNETPKHRDNFIKLIKSGFYKSKTFHRVIKGFMIQGGEANLPQLPAQIPSDYNYTIPAEINPKFYHKRGALAAARQNDEVNPNKESSSTEFYIVQGKIYKSEQLKQAETVINNQTLTGLFKKYYQSEQDRLIKKDTAFDNSYLQNAAINMAKAEFKKKKFKFTREEIDTYSSLGGAPFLDANYTVFGEVIEGLEIVDKIADVKIENGDKPVKNVKFSIKIIK